jgi:ribose/xylose/arabinose/galactoside ABC-type transport system permease subunit
MIIILMVMIWIIFSFPLKERSSVHRMFEPVPPDDGNTRSLPSVWYWLLLPEALIWRWQIRRICVGYRSLPAGIRLVQNDPRSAFLAATLSVIAGLSVGILVGMLEGYIISYLGVPAFITTLGFQWIWNGAILLVTGGRTIPANQPYFSYIAQGYLPLWMGWLVAGIVIAGLFL